MVLDNEERSRVLVIGGTGHIGKHIVAASVRRGLDQASKLDFTSIQYGSSGFVDAHTYVCCNGFAGTYLPTIGDVTAIGAGPPSHETTVLGDGDANEEDVAGHTVRAIDDPRTLNKILYMRPPANIVSHNELIAMWENKAGRTFQITRIPEPDLLKMIKEAAYPLNILLSLSLSIFVRGDLANFDIQPPFGVEATELYSDVKYSTVDEYLDRLV